VVPAQSGRAPGAATPRHRDTLAPREPAPPPERHSREGGNPETSAPCRGEALDSRLRGNDVRVGGVGPGTEPSGVLRRRDVTLKPLDSRLRGNDVLVGSRCPWTRPSGAPRRRGITLKPLDSRLRGNDIRGGVRPGTEPSGALRRCDITLKPLGSRLRGNAGREGCSGTLRSCRPPRSSAALCAFSPLAARPAGSTPRRPTRPAG